MGKNNLIPKSSQENATSPILETSHCKFDLDLKLTQNSLAGVIVLINHSNIDLDFNVRIITVNLSTILTQRIHVYAIWN